MTEKSGSTPDERRNTMSKVADLKNALTELFRKGTEVGYTETEIDEFLEDIDYQGVASAALRSMMTSLPSTFCAARYAFRAFVVREATEIKT